MFLYVCCCLLLFETLFSGKQSGISQIMEMKRRESPLGILGWEGEDSRRKQADLLKFLCRMLRMIR
jgi:hypothetical protein